MVPIVQGVYRGAYFAKYGSARKKEANDIDFFLDH